MDPNDGAPSGCGRGRAKKTKVAKNLKYSAGGPKDGGEGNDGGAGVREPRRPLFPLDSLSDELMLPADQGCSPAVA